MLTAIVWLLVVLAALVALLVLFSAWTSWRVEKAVPPVGRFIDVDGSRIHYLDEGSGPAIVLVHGIAAQLQNLTYALRERLRGEYRLIFVDRPGSGYSERRPGTSARLMAQADTVAALIAELGLEKPLLVGHSLGGAVALATALKHPRAVGGLALVAPLTHPQAGPPPALRGLAIASPLARRVVAWTLAVPQTLRNGPAALSEVFAPDPVPRDFAVRAGGLLGLRPKAFENASRDMMAVSEDLPDMVARYQSLAMPIGILYGASDKILDPKAQGEPMIGVVPGLTLELVENGGHMLPIAASERTASFIVGVLKRMHDASVRTATGA